MSDDDPAKGRIPLVIAENGRILRHLMDCSEWLRKSDKTKRGDKKAPPKEAPKRTAVDSDIDSDELVRRHQQDQGMRSAKRARYHQDDQFDSHEEEAESDDDATPPRSEKVKEMQTKTYQSRSYRSKSYQSHAAGQAKALHAKSSHVKSSNAKSSHIKASHSEHRQATPGPSCPRSNFQSMPSGSRPKPRPVAQYGRRSRYEDDYDDIPMEEDDYGYMMDYADSGEY